MREQVPGAPAPSRGGMTCGFTRPGRRVAEAERVHRVTQLHVLLRGLFRELRHTTPEPVENLEPGEPGQWMHAPVLAIMCAGIRKLDVENVVPKTRLAPALSGTTSADRSLV